MASDQLTPAQINQIARAAIKARAVKMRQQIFGQTIATPVTTQPNVTVNPRNVGLIKGFFVQVTFTVSNGSAVQINLSDFGPANIFSQIQFNDLQNNTRLQTTGWHIHLINTLKQKRVFGMADVLSSMDTPIGYGSNFAGQISAPAAIPAGGTGLCTMWFWVPLAYAEDDYRGAVYANVVNATMQLNFTFNPTPFVASGSDSTSAIYFGDVAGSVAAASITTSTINVWQVYMDQIPMGPNGVLLPVLDLATIYELKQTTITGAVANQDFPYQYANFRDFLSTIAIYVNAAAGTRANGSDINFWELLAANNTPIWKDTPALNVLQNRNGLHTDLPLGAYYFPSREKPISTTQYGNMQLINNPITAAAGAYELVAVEDFSLVQTLSMAGSLNAN